MRAKDRRDEAPSASLLGAPYTPAARAPGYGSTPRPRDEPEGHSGAPLTLVAGDDYQRTADGGQIVELGHTPICAHMTFSSRFGSIGSRNTRMISTNFELY